MTPELIEDQRAKGWVDFHPEDYCHQCGRPNIKAWFSPEWEALYGSHSGILCPVCFAALDPDAIWTLTRWTPTDDAQRGQLADVLRGCTSLGEDAERVAGCVLDAGILAKEPRMTRFKDWWTNANYDREHMRRFREERHSWDDLPDHVVATSFEFAVFSFVEAVRDVWREVKAVLRSPE